MMRLKSCPRCRGDLLIEQDHNNRSEHCIQCGYQRELKSQVEMGQSRGNNVLRFDEMRLT